MQSCAREAFLLAQKLDIGVVVDADGLWLLNSEPGLLRGLEGRVVVTPNVMEFRRLANAVVSPNLRKRERYAVGGLGVIACSMQRAPTSSSAPPAFQR